MVIKIEAGCTRNKQVPNAWIYAYQTNEGYFVWNFTAQPGEVPEIGDFIDGGVLKKREGYQIDQDHSKWKKRFEDTRAYDKMDPPSTW